MTLEEHYSSKKTFVVHLKFFGFVAFYHIPKESCNKLDIKTQKCMFLGYDEAKKIYLLYNPITRKTILS